MRTIAALLTDAEGVARRMGDSQPAAEHLLVAALQLPEGSAARALDRFGVTAERLGGAITDEHAAGLVAAGVEPEAARRLAEPTAIEPAAGSGLYRSSPSARDLFNAAASAARGAKQRLVGAHVVLAASDVEHGTLPRILDRLGVDRAQLREAARLELR
jgi:ATP-dependent Clp protease ATP-binding subunit ClpA